MNIKTVWRTVIAIAILLVGCLGLSACSEGHSAPTYPPGGNEPVETPVIPDGGEDDDDFGTVGTRLGQTAPDFTLTDSNAQSHTLYDYRGQVVILYFWTEACGYCVEQAPRMQEFQDAYPQDLLVLSVNMVDSAGIINAYLAQYELSYPGLMSTSDFQSVWGLTTVPHAIVLDRDGVVQFNAHPAYMTESTFGAHF